MGYRTVNNVPTILTHAQAKRIFEKSVPIRGRSEADSRRPLGARRDADTYHIRMNGDDVECVLYKTPVITFHTDDTITIKTDGWNSVSTHQFIWAITGCYARGSKGKTVLKVGALEHVMSDKCQMKYVGGKWEVLTTEEHYDWRIDRKKAKEVRAKYKEFNTYLSGVIKLRTTTVQDQLCIESSVYELYEGLGLTLYADHHGRESINMDAFRLLDDKNKSEHAKFMYLIGASAEDKSSDYYKAMLMLIGRCDTAKYWHASYWYLGLGRKITVYPKVLIDKAYECMYKYHSDEVFTKVKLPVGKVPSGRYDTWV